MRASIVIPAHDEASVIGTCLSALDRARKRDGLDLEIVVVANGCSDDTAQIARRYEGVLVIDEPRSSKRLALDLGDAAATAFPRIFLDADIEMGDGALTRLVEALSVDEARVGAPGVVFDVSEASMAVRSFYRVFEQLPYVRRDLVGLGVYGLSEAGRNRFAEFPELVADDLFIQRLFDEHERIVVPGQFKVRVPRTVSHLVKVRTRVARGNAELAGLADTRFEQSSGSTGRALLDLIRSDPRRAPDVACYVGVTLAARARAGFSSHTWERDDSTRTGA
ncbi:glycosyltransferase family 2 protein [Mobilicoccus sp.]|uniref:glycosyltransferase n=1 Tax=Mobilicoccus sp. TaxID=2034349 RepID=UPI0028A63B91|nr:glycosyltransferase family 2 protein [Mobilicoccus sp.]